MVSRIQFSDFKKIVVYGPSGGGKSTISTKIGNILGIDVIHIDDIFWLPNWIEMDKNELVRQIRPKLENKCWILDGNYTKVRKISIEKATLAIILLPNPNLVYWRIITRQFSRNTRINLGQHSRSPINVIDHSPSESIFKGIKVLIHSAWNFYWQKCDIILQELKSVGLENKIIFLRIKSDPYILFNYLETKQNKIK